MDSVFEVSFWSIRLLFANFVVFRQVLKSEISQKCKFQVTKCSLGIRRRTDEDEAPVFWSSDAKSQLTGNVPDAGKDWGQKKKRASEDETAGWHYLCNGTWANFRRWWETRRPGMLQSMGSQRVRHDWATEPPQNVTVHIYISLLLLEISMNFCCCCLWLQA